MHCFLLHYHNERFLDIQPLFGRVAENTSQQRSVSYAVDFYRIPKTDDFHSADRDAWYEARILKETLIDYFVIRERGEETEQSFPSLRTYISNPNLTTQKKWRGAACPTEKEAGRKSLEEKMNCPICESDLTEEIGNQTSVPFLSINAFVKSMGVTSDVYEPMEASFDMVEGMETGGGVPRTGYKFTFEDEKSASMVFTPIGAKDGDHLYLYVVANKAPKVTINEQKMQPLEMRETKINSKTQPDRRSRIL